MDDERLVGNKWRIVRLLGRGAMGRVYEVRHKQLPLRKALKQLHAELAEDPAIEKRFVEEARRGAALDHPNIVRVADIDFDEGHGPFIVMDLVEGETLGLRIQEGERFEYSEVLRVGLELASALDCAHRLGVIHRDIKPANIILESRTGQAKLTDFGIAKQVGETSDASLTGTGLYVGTVRYSSREQLRNEKEVTIDGRADLYSFGVVLYEMCAGKKYLDECSEFEIASRVGFDPEFRPALVFDNPPPAKFVALLERCLAPDREDRVESATELIAELEACRAAELGDPEADSSRDAGDMPTQIAPGAVAADRSEGASAFSVERLQQVRAELNEDAAEYETLIRSLKDLGKTPGDLLELDDISRLLNRVELLEARGELTAGQRDLSGVRATLLDASERVRVALADEIGARLEAIHGDWARLVEPPAAARERLQTLTVEIPRARESQDWPTCNALLREARELVESAREAEPAAEPTALSTPVVTPTAPAVKPEPPAAEPEPDIVPLVEELPKRSGAGRVVALVVAAAVLAGGGYFGWQMLWSQKATSSAPVARPITPSKPAPVAADPGPTAEERAAYRDHLEVARLFLDRGDYASAIEELDQALTILPGDPDATEIRDAAVRAQKAEDAILGGSS